MTKINYIYNYISNQYALFLGFVGSISSSWEICHTCHHCQIAYVCCLDSILFHVFRCVAGNISVLFPHVKIVEQTTPKMAQWKQQRSVCQALARPPSFLACNVCQCFVVLFIVIPMKILVLLKTMVSYLVAIESLNPINVVNRNCRRNHLRSKSRNTLGYTKIFLTKTLKHI